MDANFLLGALLVGVGLALAALAYSLITERTSADTEVEQAADSEPVEEPPQDEAELETTPEEEESPPPAAAPDEEEPLPASDVEPEPEMDESETGAESTLEETKSEPSPEQADSEIKPEPPKQRPTFPVATLMRDEVSGELAIKVGETFYRTKEELQASKDWSRVSFAADDLTKWMASEPAREDDVETSSARKPTSGSPDRGKDSDAPRNMVEEIDEILQEMLLDSSHTGLAVRLMEGPGGMARVLIGIDSYSIEDVPDAEIMELINQAVAQWEATR